ncbi:unnamed protein product, partial [Mesorhabditis belari]|uniref:Uncharacterized protein n=1 Tax=Mesorhabditis belari TaxID=2138241 RepID=A0AAF3EGW6_9BILA
MLDETHFGVTSPYGLQEVVVVGSENDMIIDELEKHGIQARYSDDGLDYIDQDPLFVIDDFMTRAFINLASTGRNPQKDVKSPRIVGPPYILQNLKLHQKVTLPPRNRPRFCCLMADIHVKMDVKDSDLKKELIDKFHWMSGSVKKEMGQLLTHFVGDSVSSESCRKVAALGLPLLRYTWISEAWSQAKNLNFNVMEESFLKRHTLECFEGLRFYFVGFSEEQVEEMTRIAEAKLAEVVGHMALASHLIYGTFSENLPSIPIDILAWRVTEKWFWKSVDLGRALSESDFAPNSKPIQRQNTHTTLNGSKSSILNNSNSSMISGSERSTGSPCKADKKQLIVSEMLQTETNYIEALQLLMQMKQKLAGTKENDSESWIAKNPHGNITMADANIIFGKLSPIIAAHKSIQKDLSTLVNNWTPKSAVGPIWHAHMDILSKVYPPFINTYDMAKQHFMHLDEDEHFHAFVRTCEADEKWRRQRVMDILVRPVQRLAQIFMLLEQCAKHSKKSSSDADSLSKACRKGQDILKVANESRRATEEYEKNCRLFDEIENMPPELRSSQRYLNEECIVVCLGGSGDWQRFLRKPLRLMIFNDIFVIVKRRAPPTGTISRMARHFSTNSLLSDRRKIYKFISFYSYNSGIRQIASLNDNSMDKNRLFMITLRHNEKGDEQVLLGVDEYYGHDPTHVANCMAQIEKNVFLETGRENLIEKRTLRKLPQAYTVDMVESSAISVLDETKENIIDPDMTVSCHGARRFTLRKALSNTNILQRRFHTHPLREQQSPCILEESVFVPIDDAHPSFSTSTVNVASPSASPRKGLGPKMQGVNNLLRIFRKPSFRKQDTTQLDQTAVNGKFYSKPI